LTNDVESGSNYQKPLTECSLKMKNNQYHSENIEIKGARVHNLKNIDLKITRDQLTVITGLSGSGKSSLAFDTLYAEGQRRYVESLSSYARQFLGRIHKPEVDYIKGIPPAIAVEQKVNTRNPRSTVGTSTEIYDYLKLLFVGIGETISPVSGKVVKRHSITDVIEYILALPPAGKVMILAKINLKNGRSLSEHLEILQQQGFSRVEFDQMLFKIDQILSNDKMTKPKSQFLVIDRLSVEKSEDFVSRLGDSVQTAFYEGEGECLIKSEINGKIIVENFTNRFEADGIVFEIPTIHTFSFNNPAGACPVCEGFGKTIGIDEDLVVPNKNISIYEEAVVCWKGEKMVWYRDEFIKAASKFDFPIHRPYYQLTEQNIKDLWYGNKHYEGLYTFFKNIESQSHKIQYRVMLSRFRGKTVCPECKGTRLKKQASYIKINEKSISDLVVLPIKQLRNFFKDLKLTPHQKEISKRVLIEINNRLQYLSDVGLSYLTLNRLSASLSGGESQRINLAGSLGSSLVGSLYILDEPSIGLHPRDTDLLIKVLLQLRDIGNTVVVVEHDEDIISAADQIIDIGPLAGTLGGNVVFQGTINELRNKKGKDYPDSMTAKYLNGTLSVDVPAKRRNWNHFVEIIGACENNLKNINIKFPLNVMTVVTGVSGSGKSSLVKNVLYPAVAKNLEGYSAQSAKYARIEGDFKQIESIEFVDQNPIGKSSRSNPVTYLKAFDDIRKLFSEQNLSKINGFTSSHFSFNVEGGRCEECKGEGEITVEMQFMADVHLVCEHCKGKRFKDEVLEVQYKGKNIFDILELTVDESIAFFENEKETKKIAEKIKTLQDVGLGYVKLGQSSNTLSGGESQRIKLAYFLSKENRAKNTLFIFDEPTTGLHFHDINRLLAALNALLDRGHTVVIIEHNREMIKCADYIIDLGPEGGDEGGQVVFTGTPEELLNCEKSHTAKYLQTIL